MTDGEDVRTRVEDALRRAAASAYEAAHGALEQHDTSGDPPRWRFRVSLRVAVTATVIVAIVAAVAVYLPRGVGRVGPDPIAGDVATDPEPSSATAMAILPAGSVVVHVVGAVVSPGLYTLDGGARIAEAVAAAGGVSEGGDLDSLNLARGVVDGEPVRVPLVGESVMGDGRININLADVGTLEGLPGVGPVLAARIAEYREAHGPFASVDALDDVSGVGPAVLEKMRAAATV